MPLVEGYSSTSESEGDQIEEIETLDKGNGQKVENSGVLILNKVADPTSSVSVGIERKRHNLSKSNLKAKRSKRKGKGPWAKWDSSSDSNDDAGLGEDYVSDLVAPELDATEVPIDNEQSTFHGKAQKDYLGRGILHPPADVGVEFDKEPLSFKCYLPKKIIHRYEGHKGGVTALHFIPKSAHLFASGGNDNTVRLWDMYHDRGLLRDYCGHSKPIRDISFSPSGAQLASSSYDGSVKIWDTETGDVKHRILPHAIPNCISFHPINGNELIVGLSNSEIKHYDLRTSGKNAVIQTYDHHTSAVNALKYFPDGSKFISSSDDKTVRIWDNQINIPIKQIADTSQYSMPWLQVHPEKNYFASQCMDNSIQVFSMKPKYKRHPKKTFKGHMVTGFNIKLDISPDGKYLTSGDAKGKLYIWDWKTAKILKTLNVPAEDALTNVAWSPQETSKVICGGTNGRISLFD
ncbi:HHR175Cp [Eremothecium sinecaudum]|uniref:Pre-mRNA-processing factor 17 n=1 Tax=Eremothecium sinecaudum TaxID=45286 RepID=A0A0X8HWX0_9SACH|nr:HHR175Cp [Eremothecium sinecaudum]AMD22944.1 HHR175Cp [Eremothecium sinecaudum]